MAANEVQLGDMVGEKRTMGNRRRMEFLNVFSESRDQNRTLGGDNPGRGTC